MKGSLKYWLLWYAWWLQATEGRRAGSCLGPALRTAAGCPAVSVWSQAESWAGETESLCHPAGSCGWEGQAGRGVHTTGTVCVCVWVYCFAAHNSACQWQNVFGSQVALQEGLENVQNFFQKTTCRLPLSPSLVAKELNIKVTWAHTSTHWKLKPQKN